VRLKVETGERQSDKLDSTTEAISSLQHQGRPILITQGEVKTKHVTEASGFLGREYWDSDHGESEEDTSKRVAIDGNRRRVSAALSHLQ